MFWEVSKIGSEVTGLFWIFVFKYFTGLFVLGLFLSLVTLVSDSGS